MDVSRMDFWLTEIHVEMFTFHRKRVSAASQFVIGGGAPHA
jgi:hypothetical protein